MNRLIKKADILIEALPIFGPWPGKTVVIKYGGSAMVHEVQGRLRRRCRLIKIRWAATDYRSWRRTTN
ncbi:MAG: hypothetical protein R3B95_08850 [Nitrospirales bacterium]|nr:hypothetical protein [Nitrospirales bacterium]